MPGQSHLDSQVLNGVGRDGRKAIGLGRSALDDQVLDARPRRRMRGMGDDLPTPPDLTPGVDYNPVPNVQFTLPSSPNPFNWNEFNTILGAGTNLVSNILKLRPPAGTSIYQTPQGGFFSSAAMPGVPTAQLLPPGLFSTGVGSYLPILLIGGGLLVVMMMAGRK